MGLGFGLNGDFYHLGGGGGDGGVSVGAVAYNPEYLVVGIDEEGLALFVEKAEFMVGEVVAEELRAFHAEGIEAVAVAPVAEA